VREGADAAVADGSRERPWPRIGSALERSPGAAWIAVAAGRYVERFDLERSARVLGVCAARVEVAPPEAEATERLGPRVRGAGVAVELAGVTLRGHWRALTVEAGASLTLRGSRLAAVGTRGLHALGPGTTVTLRDMYGDGDGASVDPLLGWAILAEAGARVEGERVHLAGFLRGGVWAGGVGAAVSLRDAVVRDMRPSPDGLRGWGAFAAVGGEVRLARALVAGNRSAGVHGQGLGAHIALDDVVVRDTQPPPRDVTSYAVTATQGSVTEARRVLVERAQGVGVVASGDRSALVLEDAVVRAVRPQGAYDGHALVAYYGGRMVVRRARVEDVGGPGASVVHRGSELDLEDVVVRRTRAPGDRNPAPCVSASEGGAARLRRVHLEDCREAGLLVRAARADVAWLSVSRVPQGLPINGAVGLFFDAAATASVRGARLEGARDFAVYARGVGTELAVEDLVASAPEGAADPRSHVGLVAVAGARVDLSQARFGQGFAAGVVAEGARVTARDLDVSALVARDGGRVPAGLLALAGGSIDAERAWLHDLPGVGAAAAQGGALALRDARIARVRGLPDGNLGVGLFAARGEVDAARVRVEAAEQFGALSVGGRMAFRDGVVQATGPTTDGRGGVGLAAFEGGAAAVTRAAVLDGGDFGVLARDPSSRVALTDVLVRGTRPVFDGSASGGVALALGATGSLDRVWVTGVHHAGVQAVGDGSAVTLRDVVVDDVRPTRLGFGVGVVAAAGGRATVEGAALRGLGGYAVGAVVGRSERGAAVGGSAVVARDLYIDGVAERPVRFELPVGPPVSFGIHVGEGCDVSLDRAVVTGASWGFFQQSGALRWRDGVVAPTAATGASNDATTARPLELVRVSAVGRAAGVLRGVALPESLLPPPQAPCAEPPCAAAPR